ncbi:hypothetical protein KUCAC02_015900, partial [Chaenocephalus aceratus]
ENHHILMSKNVKEAFQQREVEPSVDLHPQAVFLSSVEAKGATHALNGRESEEESPITQRGFFSIPQDLASQLRLEWAIGSGHRAQQPDLNRLSDFIQEGLSSHLLLRSNADKNTHMKLPFQTHHIKGVQRAGRLTACSPDCVELLSRVLNTLR